MALKPFRNPRLESQRLDHVLSEAETSEPTQPTDDEKAALAGTTGTPSGTNKFVTNTDPRFSAIDGGTP